MPKDKEKELQRYLDWLKEQPGNPWADEDKKRGVKIGKAIIEPSVTIGNAEIESPLSRAAVEGRYLARRLPQSVVEHVNPQRGIDAPGAIAETVGRAVTSAAPNSLAGRYIPREEQQAYLPVGGSFALRPATEAPQRTQEYADYLKRNRDKRIDSAQRYLDYVLPRLRGPLGNR